MSYKHSRVLFLLEDGRAMRFYMPPSEERARLRPIVEHGGGIISSKFERHSIRLAVPGKEIHEDGALDTKFITDCVEKNELLSMNKYKLRSGRRVSLKDDDLEPSSHILHVENKDRKGRKMYKFSEDKAIINYLLSTRGYAIGGTKIWKEMEFREVVPGRSWQSLKDRYRKNILPNIQSSYRLKKYERAKLINAAVGLNNTGIDMGESVLSGTGLSTDTRNTPKAKTSLRSKSPSCKAKKKKLADTKDAEQDLTETIDDFDRELLTLASAVGTKTQEDSDNTEDVTAIKSNNKKPDDVLDTSLSPPPQKKTRNDHEQNHRAVKELPTSTEYEKAPDVIEKRSPRKKGNSEQENVSDTDHVSPLKRALRSRKPSQKDKPSDGDTIEVKKKHHCDENKGSHHDKETGCQKVSAASKMTSPRKDKGASLLDELDVRESRDTDDFEAPLERCTRHKVPLTMVSAKKKLKVTKVKSQEDESDSLEASDNVKTRELRSRDKVASKTNKNTNNSSHLPKRMLKSQNVSKDQDISGVQLLETSDSESDASADVDSVPKPLKPTIKSSKDARKNRYKQMPQSPVRPLSDSNENNSQEQEDSVNGSVFGEDNAALKGKKNNRNSSDTDHCNKTNNSSESLSQQQNSSVFPMCYSHKKKKTPLKQKGRHPAKSDSKTVYNFESNSTDHESDSGHIASPNGDAKKQRQSYQKLGSSLRNFLMAETQSSQSQCTQPEHEEEPLDDHDEKLLMEKSKKYQSYVKGVADALELTPKILLDVCHWVSGSLDDAISCIIHGQTQSGKAVWKAGDDAMLQDGGEAEYRVLEQKYGEQEVTARQQYLAENLIQE